MPRGAYRGAAAASPPRGAAPARRSRTEVPAKHTISHFPFKVPPLGLSLYHRVIQVTGLTGIRLVISVDFSSVNRPLPSTFSCATPTITSILPSRVADSLPRGSMTDLRAYVKSRHVSVQNCTPS